MIDYSIIVPCYNEAENIKPLINGFTSLIGDNAELIIVDNGSYDETPALKDELTNKYPFVKWIRIEKNIGYGYGIHTGLKHARGKYVGYTHADLQTDPADIKKAVELIKSSGDNGPVLIKGYRRGRGFSERFFSRGMEFAVRLVLKKKLTEINAQPNVFTRDILDILVTPPLHWGFDLYLYFTAMKAGSMIIRFDVLFPPRISGSSKWNTGFIAKLIFSHKIFKYCFELKRL